MSHAYTPVIRRENVIGCNIRPGMTPGGFAPSFSGRHFNLDTRNAWQKSREIREAANAVLEKRANPNDPYLGNPSRETGIFE